MTSTTVGNTPARSASLRHIQHMFSSNHFQNIPLQQIIQLHFHLQWKLVRSSAYEHVKIVYNGGDMMQTPP